MQGKNPPGRQLIEIDWNKVDTLIRHQCTGEEVAGELGICYDTLVSRIQEKDNGIYSGFSEYASSKKSSGKARLRSSQFAKALKGDSKMLDKLGDVYLGQARKETELPPNEPTLMDLHNVLGENKSLKEQLEQLQKEFDAFKSQADPLIPTSDQTL